MSELLLSAFQALGVAPSYREITLVANALRTSEDAEVCELLGAWPPGDEEWDRLVSVADAGAGGLVALDLATEFQSPGTFEALAAGGGEGT
ncbi:MAG: hypothetical protein AABM43_13295 [Actinomycetota bacterium]